MEFEEEEEEEEEEDAAVMVSGESWVQHLPATVRRQLAKRRPRRRFTAMTRSALARNVEQATELLGQSKAVSTWNGYCTVISAFVAFDEAQRAPGSQVRQSWSRTALAERMVQFVVWDMTAPADPEIGRKKPLSKQAARKYIEKLRSMYVTTVGSKAGSENLDALHEAVQRLGGLVPLNPSVPITPAHMRTVIAEVLHPRTKENLRWLWLSASRTHDLQLLRKMDITIAPVPRAPAQRLVELRWVHGVKGSFHAIHDLVEVSSDLAARLQEVLDPLRPNENPFVMGPAQVTEILRSLFPQYRSHSIKKGSLTHLAKNKIPIEGLMKKAKHKNAEDLKSYLSPSLWAEMHHAMESSGLLAAALDGQGLEV
jgi:hypothetical protein